MDFSRRGVERKQMYIKSPLKRFVNKLWVGAFRIVIVVIVCGVIAGATAAYGALNALIDIAPDVSNINVVPTGYVSYSYYSDGTLAQTFAGEQANRIYVTYDEIPEVVINAFVALEDERFWDHHGIDVRGIFRAGVSILHEGGLGYGASTITQQLLKNFVFEGGNEKNYLDKIVRKVQEQYLAIQLENQLTKEQILEYYLNYINLGNGAYGICMAAKSYFGKDLSQLTISEAATIAPIALSPTNQNPITHPDINAKRRESCLNNMYEQGYISKEELDEALADDVYSRVKLIKDENDEKAVSYSYFTDEVLEQVSDDLQERLGMTAAEATNLIYRGGISIYTTQDPTIQAIVDKYYTDEENFPDFGFSSGKGSCYELEYALSVYHKDGSVTHYQRKDFLDYFADYQDNDKLYYHKDGGKKGISELLLDQDDCDAKIEEFKAAVTVESDDIQERKVYTPQPQSSFSIIEQSTGKVVAIYGGRGEKTGNRTLNRASNTVRQVGSTFKVLASFLPGLDAGGKTLASVYDDYKYCYPGTTKEVINWYSGFRGLQTIRRGIYNSLNIVAVKNLESIGASTGFEYLEKLGFTTLVKSRTGANGEIYSDINLAIALGGLTDGVTNVEICAAYAAIANQGVYNKPYYYTKVVDSEGKVILSNETKSTQVMKTSTAWLITDAMHDTTEIGTGGNLRFKNYKMPVAGKTGTATGNNDFWFVGYTPYYTAAVWTGYDNNFKQIDKSYQQHIWRKIMEEVHETLELPYKTWEKPDNIVTATICTKCGKLAVSGLCDQAEGGSCSFTEYFAKGTVPTEMCDCHVRVSVCKKTGQLPCDSCKKVVEKVLLIKDESIYPLQCETEDTPYIVPTVICEKHSAGEFDADEIDLDENGNPITPEGEAGENAEGNSGETP